MSSNEISEPRQMWFVGENRFSENFWERKCLITHTTTTTGGLPSGSITTEEMRTWEQKKKLISIFSHHHHPTLRAQNKLDLAFSFSLMKVVKTSRKGQDELNFNRFSMKVFLYASENRNGIRNYSLRNNIESREPLPGEMSTWPPSKFDIFISVLLYLTRSSLDRTTLIRYNESFHKSNRT